MNYISIDGYIDSSLYQQLILEFQRQVDYIELTRLPKETIDFFKTIPLILRLDDQISPDADAFYNRFSKKIELRASAFCWSQVNDIKRPILLHELLRAFHHQRLPNGVTNRDIIKFFQESRAHHYYELPNTWYSDFIDYLTSNELEFFACTASAFLVDFEIWQPFNRDNIYQHQSEYYHYLQKIFGVDPYQMPVEKMNLPNIESLY